MALISRFIRPEVQRIKGLLGRISRSVRMAGTSRNTETIRVPGSDKESARKKVSSDNWMKRACMVSGPTMFTLLAFMVSPPGLSSSGSIVLGVVAWMALWWISECVPLPATALLPIIIFPLSGVVDSGGVFSAYSNNIIFLFMGGFLLAGALEKWGVHKRMAIGIIRVLGTSVSRLILGFMIATSVLAFFVTNTAATMMMLPMALALISSMKDAEKGVGGGGDAGRFEKALVFGVGYSATISGMSTVLGSTSNSFFISHANEVLGVEISFAQFAAFAVPFALVFLLLFWLYLVKFRYRMRMKDIPGGRAIIEEHRRALGRMSTAEILVTGVGVCVSVLWFTRTWLVEPLMPEVTDGMIAVLGAILLFLLPSGRAEAPRLLEWKDTKRVPWGVLLLLGGGFALADSVESSGLSHWVSDRFIGLEGVPGVVFLVIIVISLAMLTEFTSTSATAILFVPLMGTVALALGYDPLFVMLTANLAVSCAFMLPAATPPNSVIYGTGIITIGDMVKTGFFVTMLGCLLIVVAMYAWAPVIFTFG